MIKYIHSLRTWSMTFIPAWPTPLRRIALGLGLVLMIPGVSHGFDDKITHPQITRSAVRASILDSFLRNNLGLSNGIQSQIRSTSGTTQNVGDWLDDGSTLEDSPPCRASNHFHNPLKPFTESAVSDLDVFHLFCGGGPLYPKLIWGMQRSSAST
jgi:hypothetical protein